MFKRANKITALLVAAASVMSVVPAMATDTTRLGTKEGTVKQGVAYADGKYSYYGYRTSDDHTGVYYNNGGDAKDTFNSELEDYRLDTVSKYGQKYAYAKEDSNADEYLVDLSTGKIVDDVTAEQKEDSAKIDLRTSLKRASRYSIIKSGDGDITEFNRISKDQFGDVWYQYKADAETNGTTAVAATNASISISVPTEASISNAIKAYEIAKINGTTATLPTAKIDGVTYSYNKTPQVTGEFTDYSNLIALAKLSIDAKLSTADTNATTADAAGTAAFAGLFGGKTFALNAAGNALEVSSTVTFDAADTHVSQVKGVYSDAFAGEFVNGKGASTATNVTQYYGFTDDNGKYVDANYVANTYVFSKTKGRAVKVQNFGEENSDAELTVNLVSLEAIDQDKDFIYAIAKVNVTGNGALEGTQYFLQKISKARGEQHDGAYTPKTVNSYELNINGTYDNGDARDAAHALLDSSFDGHGYLLGAQVVNGNTIYVTRLNPGTDDTDNVKLYKLELKESVKADVVGSGFLKTDVDAPLVKKTGDTDRDIKHIDFEGGIEDKGLQGIQNTGLSINNNTIYRDPEVSFDVTGNTWVVDRGSIVKFDGTDKKTMFTCDRAMDGIDVYDDNSLIAWDINGDAYTTVKEGTKVTQDEATVVAPVIVTGWVQAADKTWSFNDQTGAKVTSKWINVGGSWYFLKADGVMATGWYQDGATWYYLQPSGAMATGWLNDNGTWYYLAGSGAMLSNTTVDGYKLGATGAWVK